MLQASRILEGCFLISITKNKELKIGWYVKAYFQISLYKKDKAILEQIQSFFGVGSIVKQGTDAIKYRVGSVKNLAIRHKSFWEIPFNFKKTCGLQFI